MSEEINEVVRSVQSAIEPLVLGQSEVTRLLVGAFLIGGHVLLEGPPGVGKTRLAKMFSATLGLTFSRIQFTPDLMPSDITGVNVYDQRSGEFRFAPGPLLSDIVLADEINRTPPKTQAALLEAMEERSITIDGIRHDLHQFFFVIATQNPIEHEGTFPLPEAQLDRFLFKLKVGYPAPAEEIRMIEEFSGQARDLDKNITSKMQSIGLEKIKAASQAQRAITLAPAMADYIHRIFMYSREHPDILLGGSPRAALHMALASKFQASLSNRSYVIPDDVKAVAVPLLAHRLVFKPESYERVPFAQDVVEEILAHVPVPERVVV